ncbi:MAG TPA: tetratricopeptide repeat protein [Gemmatimonadales bacterium]|nr:tetratricopeptide repeat protein [Gemmatimonadales bacterium]
MRFAGLAVAALLTAAATPLAAQGTSDHLQAGIAAEQNRDPKAALQQFEAVLAADSTNYEANWRAALALIDLGKQTPDEVTSPARDSLYHRAERYARRAVTANPNGADGHFVLANAIGRASLTLGKKERVRRAAEIRNEALKAIDLDPKQDGAYHVLGRWNAEIMRLSGVTRFFAKSFLGAEIFDKASWESAVSNMEKAVELNPTRIYHRLDLAEIYVDLGRYDDARAQLNRIQSLPVKDVMDPTYKQQAADLLKKIGNKKG